MTKEAQEFIPSEVLDSFYPDGIVSYSEIKGGEINTTLAVTDSSDNRSILQGLSDIYDTAMEEDYEVVSGHLKKEGWEIATLSQGDDGRAYLRDGSGRLWRSLNYIESEPGSNYEGNLEATTALGGLLGALHRSLGILEYQPRFKVPHSQDTGYYTARLEEVQDKIPGADNRELAAEMIARSSTSALESGSSQLIHGDPRIGNSLFRDGKPFTFIDWDGLKFGSPLLDIGDLLQSTAGEVFTKGKGDCTIEELLPILKAYCSELEIDADYEAFSEDALVFARAIALNLGMRHLIDTVEDSYFRWDPDRFESRLDFNLSCARRQKKVYNLFS